MALLGGENPKFVSKLVTLTQELDALAVDQRLSNNEAATNCAKAAATRRQSWY
jgi:hypothetical protein